MKTVLLTGAASLALISGQPVYAQEAASTSAASSENEATSTSDIIVTARRREETLQDVPVVISAFGKGQIDRLGISSLDDVASYTPSFLSYSDGSGGLQGVKAIRGVSTGFLVSGGAQAVSTNVDGIQLSQGFADRAGQIDISRIEVLKGPQALFFGKNSTAGVVAFTSADPTHDLFVQARASYGFQSEERLGELIVSGPLTDAVGARIVLYGSDMDGFQRNLANGQRLPGVRDLFGRLTLTYKDNGPFDARLKVSYFDENGDSRGTARNRTNCQLPAFGDDCTADNRVWVVDVPAYPPLQNVNQLLTSLEMNYQLGDRLKLSSISGYQDAKIHQRGNSTTGFLASVQTDNIDVSHTFSQEIRLSSDFGGPLNFMLGAFYERASINQVYDIVFNPIHFPKTDQTITSNTWSGFGQLTYDITDQVELSGGARYSHINSKFKGETLTTGNSGGFPLATVGPIGNGFILDDDKNFNNLSPEVSLTWRPTSSITLFAAYKQGFKAGGFELSPTRTAILRAPGDISYGSEKAKGGEIGFKTEWFGRSLRFNGAAYLYDYSDLQLSAFDPATVSTRVYNAGASRVQGAEFDLSWTPLGQDAFTLIGALSYNHGRFRSFVADCNQSQIAGLASGCVERNGTAGLQTSDANDVAGKPLPFAPDWSGSIGFNLDQSISGGDTKFRANATFLFSSSYLANSSGSQDPLDFENGYTQVNGGIGIHNEERGWAVDLIVRNLLNEYYIRQSLDLPGLGLERQQLVNRPREAVLQLTLRPSQFFH